MPHISIEDLNKIGDELAFKDEIIAELQEELMQALEDVTALKGQLAILRQDRRYEVA